MLAWLLLWVVILYCEFIFDQSLFMGILRILVQWTLFQEYLYFLLLYTIVGLLSYVRGSFMARYYQRNLYSCVQFKHGRHIVFFPWSSLKILAFCSCLHSNLLPSPPHHLLYAFGVALFHWRDSKTSGFRYHRSANVSKVSDFSAGLLLWLLFLSSWGTEDSPEFLESSALPVVTYLSFFSALQWEKVLNTESIRFIRT